MLCRFLFRFLLNPTTQSVFAMMQLILKQAAIVFSMLAMMVQADTIVLKNGNIIEGKILSQNSGVVSVEVDGIATQWQSQDIKSITMGDTATAASSQAAEQASQGVLEIPAGTVMMINLTSSLDSGKNSSGHKFNATLEGALMHNNIAVVPAGSRLYGVVVDAQKSRRVAGNASLKITITDINIDGHIVPVKTDVVDVGTQSTGQTSAGRVARGAAVGAIADGSSGARTGAKVGAGVSVLSRGNQVVIPAGTLMEFMLKSPLQVNQ